MIMLEIVSEHFVGNKCPQKLFSQKGISGHWVHQLPLLVTEKKSPLATDDSNHHLYYLFLFWGDLFSQNVTLQLLILLRLIDILQLCCPITDF